MLIGFFKNIVAEITGGNRDLSREIDKVFEAKATCETCFAYDCTCDGGFVALPTVDGSTKRFLYVVNNQLFFGTKADVVSVRGGGENTGTRIDD